MDLSKLKADPEREKGAWVAVAPGCSVLVAYTNSKEYRKELGKALRPYRGVVRRTGDFDAIPESDQEAISVRMLVEHTVFDWKGVQLPNEKGVLVEIPFTKANAERVLLEYPEFRQMVEEAAATLTNFREADKVEDEKNLETASAGT